MKIVLGIYEKALPKNISWLERLQLVAELGFDFLEISVDETDERLARLNWSLGEQLEVVCACKLTKIPIRSLCLSANRRYPLGSMDESIRIKALEIIEKACALALSLGVRVIQMAGYDVYYEQKSEQTKANYITGMKEALKIAARYQIVLAIETMDDPFMSSITKYLEIKKQLPSPWLQVYPDLGNLSAWPENDVSVELEKGKDEIAAIHLKDTLAVSEEFPGKFRDVPFGSGCVDFLSHLKKLVELDYSGPFLLEMWSEDSVDFKSEISEAKKYMIAQLEGAGFKC
ncbi:L-xylulose 5-phosphate 3-epimerase [Erysipelotrichaceae bacterium]|nr:L-xylulose 5-phosphate 3-epimerase [Erysipelotrichaceae bacterium]